MNASHSDSRNGRDNERNSIIHTDTDEEHNSNGIDDFDDVGQN
jgi:hypothetical protein